jgi:hypothetical protein
MKVMVAYRYVLSPVRLQVEDPKETAETKACLLLRMTHNYNMGLDRYYMFFKNISRVAKGRTGNIIFGGMWKEE